MAVAPVHISISPDILTTIGGFPITNTLLTSWIVIALLTLLSWLFTRNLSIVPGRMQGFGEAVVEGLMSFFTMVSGNAQLARRHFGIVATIFLYVMMSNWLGIFPGVGTIGVWHEVHHSDAEEVNAQTLASAEASAERRPQGFLATTSTTSVGVIDMHTKKQLSTTSSSSVISAVSGVSPDGGDNPTHLEGENHSEAPAKILTPLFRSVNSDLNMTLALAMFVVTVSHIIGISRLGAKHHIGKFLNFSNPINFFVGILELVGEFSRMISFSFRLFGNIFAGEVLLVIISFLVPYIVPLPFLGLELFVGIVQATIFATLAIIFIGQAETSHEGSH